MASVNLGYCVNCGVVFYATLDKDLSIYCVYCVVDIFNVAFLLTMKTKKVLTAIGIVVLIIILFIVGAYLSAKCYNFIGDTCCVDVPENVLCSCNYALCILPFITCVGLALMLSAMRWG